MSLRLVLVVAVLAGCGGSSKDKNEPTTAREKQRRDAKANGELDASTKSWGKWRYGGERGSCFYVVGGKCFKTENGACQAAHCKTPKKCTTTGGGPATVSCK